jgi:hypothetical protein
VSARDSGSIRFSKKRNIWSYLKLGRLSLTRRLCNSLDENTVNLTVNLASKIFDVVAFISKD